LFVRRPLSILFVEVTFPLLLWLFDILGIFFESLVKSGKKKKNNKIKKIINSGIHKKGSGSEIKSLFLISRNKRSDVVPHKLYLHG